MEDINRTEKVSGKDENQMKIVRIKKARPLPVYHRF